jgi:phosphatidylserine decarboxylase
VSRDDLLVAEGDGVRAGETIIAERPDAADPAA